MKKLSKTEKALIRNTWKAWAKYTRLCVGVAARYESGQLTSFQLHEMFRLDPLCRDALCEWFSLSSLCDELELNYLNLSDIDEETRAAADEHTLCTKTIWAHGRHTA